MSDALSGGSLSRPFQSARAGAGVPPRKPGTSAVIATAEDRMTVARFG